MALSYSTYGFCLACSAAEISGISHKLLNFEKHAANQLTKDCFKTLKADLALLDEAIEVAKKQAASKALSAVLSNAKQAYSSIKHNVQAFVNSRVEAKRNAALSVEKRIKDVSKLFKGKVNEQLGRLESEIKLLAKVSADLKAIGCDEFLTEMQDLVKTYHQNFEGIVVDNVSNKVETATRLRTVVSNDLQKLNQTLRSYQVVGPFEDKLVQYLLPIWREGRNSQNSSKKKSSSSEL